MKVQMNRVLTLEIDQCKKTASILCSVCSQFHIAYDFNGRMDLYDFYSEYLIPITELHRSCEARKETA